MIDYIVIGVIVVAVIFAIISIIVDKKKGKTQCGCDCANCSACSKNGKGCKKIK